MKNNIVVVFSSHLSEEENQKFIKHINNTIGKVKHDVICYSNFNQYSLTEIYNKAIKEHYKKDSIFVVCHNDIIIGTRDWGKLLLFKFNQTNFDIIGVAGSTYLPESCVWWEDRTKMVGIVDHTDGYSIWTSEYSKEKKGVITPVVLVDGLFISFNPDTIVHRFDEEFKGFHLYDLSFCIPNWLDGCDIGVTTDIRILHKSIGETNQQWDENRKQLAEKYYDELPITILPEYNDLIVNLLTEPKVTVIIPTKNNLKYIKNNIYSWNNVVNYDNYEIIIADTGSDESVIKEYDSFLSNKIKLIKYNYYNFAKINNDVVKNHTSNDTELILFCNDDIKLLNDSLSRCIEIYNQNKDTVGTIGIRLHYGDGSIQHNGILMYKENNILRLTHKDIRKTENYFTGINYDSLGNTGGFMLIKKDLFLKYGGFNENYIECLEDVELNIKCKYDGLKNITVSDAVAIHYESISRNKILGGNERFMVDYNRLMNFVNDFENKEREIKRNKENKNPIINIITRTHDRPKHFKICRDSILNQTYKNINHIVGSDIDCDYCDDYIKLELQEVQPKPDNLASYPAPWNLHINVLHNYVKEGWIMYLDDDDMFINENSLSIIVNHIENEDELLLWRVNINGRIVPDDNGFGKIIAGNISSIGFMFHSKYLPIDWVSWNFGDYRAIKQLENKKLKQKWINQVLTKTQGVPNLGKKPNDYE